MKLTKGSNLNLALLGEIIILNREFIDLVNKIYENHMEDLTEEEAEHIFAALESLKLVVIHGQSIVQSTAS